MEDWLCRRDVVIFTAMVATEVSKVGMNTLFKAATSKGMSLYIFLVYSYALGSLLLLPFSLFSHRSRSLPPLSFSIICKVGLLGLLGSMYVIMGYTGVEYSSPTLASAISNLTPALAFILAIIFGMEKVSLRKESTVAKVVGTIVSIAGALVATLYHGPAVFVASQPYARYLHQPQPPTPPLRQSSSNFDWVLGGGLLALENVFVAISYIVQAQIMSRYPSEFTVTNIYAVFVSILCASVSIVAERNNPSAWIIKSQISWVCIVAAGIQNFGYYVIHMWAVRHKGPVFVAMFRPLSIIIAVAMGAIFLGDSLYLGSLIGGTLISIGFYTVMWGKAKEGKADPVSDSHESQASEKVPFLINYEDERI